MRERERDRGASKYGGVGDDSEKESVGWQYSGARQYGRLLEGGSYTRVGLFAAWPELIITDGYQPVNSDTPLRASPAALSLFISLSLSLLSLYLPPSHSPLNHCSLLLCPILLHPLRPRHRRHRPCNDHLLPFLISFCRTYTMCVRLGKIAKSKSHNQILITLLLVNDSWRLYQIS